LWQISDDFSLVSLGDAFVYRRLDQRTEPDSEPAYRRVLPDRRTEDEPRPTRADRRRGYNDRRGRAGDTVVEVPKLPRLVTPAMPDVGEPEPVPAGPAPDPLDAVRVAIADGRYAEAADIAGEVTAATPLWAQAHYLQGVALTNLGRDEEALVVLRKTVYLDPEHGLAHFMLGGALERSGELVAASRSYRAAAATLGRRPLDGVATELGGRSVAELAALCMQLAQRADHASRAEGGV